MKRNLVILNVLILVLCSISVNAVSNDDVRLLIDDEAVLYNDGVGYPYTIYHATKYISKIEEKERPTKFAIIYDGIHRRFTYINS